MKMIPRAMIIWNAYWLKMLIASRRKANAPTKIAGVTGTRRLPDTWARRDANGRLLSRPIANRIRTPIAWMARQQTKIAIATSARKILPHVDPSTSVVIPDRLSDVGSL